MWEHELPSSAWHFVSLPEDVADEIEALHRHQGSPFGTVRVEVTIGSTRWSTSVFPGTTRATYLLPAKEAVRRTEGLGAGSVVHVHLVVVPGWSPGSARA